MLGFRKYWTQKRHAATLRDIRRDPHLARDIGIAPIAPTKRQQVYW